MSLAAYALPCLSSYWWLQRYAGVAPRLVIHWMPLFRIKFCQILLWPLIKIKLMACIHPKAPALFIWLRRTEMSLKNMHVCTSPEHVCPNLTWYMLLSRTSFVRVVPHTHACVPALHISHLQ
jgi:hypothetical protein